MIKSKVYNAELKGSKHDNVLLKFKSDKRAKRLLSEPNSFNIMVHAHSGILFPAYARITVIERRTAAEIRAYADVTKPLLISFIVGILAALASYLVNYNFITSLYTFILSPLLFIMMRNQIRKEVVQYIERIINS